MGKTISRQALYDVVWTQPITRLSKEFGVSDVGLAKACRKLAVPLPPRGWWARNAAGQTVIRAALPPRPPGLDFETKIGSGGAGWGWSGPPDEEFLGPIPPPPTFEEPIEQVRARVEAMVGRFAVVQRNLNNPHPAVGKLLAKDAERRAAAAARTYVSLWDAPLYDSPLQQRRLRLISCILATTARCGCRAETWAQQDKSKPVEEFSVIVGDTRVRLLVSAVEPKGRQGGAEATGRPRAPTLRVELGDGARVWVDVDAGDGAVVREIAVAAVLKGEEDLRAAAASRHAWWLGRREAIIERHRKEAEEAARKELEKLAELERLRVERLLGEAEALRRARAIRAYVQEVRSAAPPVPQAELDTWAAWALEQADRIDPVFSGAFLADRE